MIRKLTFAAALLSAPMAYADEAAIEAGENLFNRNCVSCHVVRDADDNLLAGRNGRTGPNLYGVIGGVAGSVEGFRYSSLMEAAHAAEITWDEDNFVAYVPNATAFLTEATGERGRSTMTPQRVNEEDAHNIYAFLAQWGTMSEEGEEEEASQ